MTRLCQRHGGVNLAQGFPDFPAVQALKDAAARAVQEDVNQYAITWGAKSLRDAIAAKSARFGGLTLDPETEMTVCCGSTECMVATLLALVNPGEEVVIFEPFYENYGPDAILCGATPRFVRLREPDWSFDPEELASAFGNRTKAIVINTPNNPTGKVFRHDELEQIATLCRKWDVVAVTDEIYEHILYDDAQHVSLAGLEGMRERTVTISGVSKTYGVTGWRIGYCLAPPSITSAIRKVHDFLTVGAPAPLQEAAAVALSLPDIYYMNLARAYEERRDLLLPALQAAGFRTFVPRGAYYVMTDISAFGFSDDVTFARYLVEDGGVAAVPGSSFYSDPATGRQRLRFHFARRRETLAAAAERLGRLSARSSTG
ncbi:MAG: aminotransferase class I/II-fold pyridoxal phosphate-dependent enzyme [Candidatus Eisenbacteria bacterium]|uniref:Aminotransferase n=1 Tax=Eiseniibacteriota bacterium TaxID=2212470 RepID=A0A538U3F1_UNCEI|nr:MAG: aminotransferase class I/II-fold pyridoxal phosphate-dependent enzyme [Candidatus Eisenbacteria bacterium]